jgi:hypothetical protein
MANSTGSRICEGSANQNPVKACTQIDYDHRRDTDQADPHTFVRQAVHTVADDQRSIARRSNPADRPGLTGC